MTILDTIIAYKLSEVEGKKKDVPIEKIWEQKHYDRNTKSMVDALRNKNVGIIAEHKRRSPSKSVINNSLEVSKVVSGYSENGAAAISVLTDSKFFGGKDEDLLTAREFTDIPLLRKEFIIDSYQIHEAKALGADAILLIAAVLSTEELQDFAQLAHELNLEVLLEVHNTAELEQSLYPEVDMLGVNNRNLKTFEVSLETSKALSTMIPDSFLKVSESGISDPAAVRELMDFGFEGFLIGEHFMRSEDPGLSLNSFISKVNA